MKTVYYSDELNDDFALPEGKSFKKKVIPADYKYIHKNPIWHIFSFIFYRIFATTIAYVYCYIGKGLRVKNKKALKKVKGGFFFYGNHTSAAADAFVPSILCFPKKNYIVANADVVSIPVIRFLTPLMGALPLPSTMNGMKNLISSMKTLTKKYAITIYPEAHIWPYYNGVRPFLDTSFNYPMKFNVPAVPYVTTYRKRKILRFLKPAITVTVGEPIFPADVKDKTEMRNIAYEFMKKTIEQEGSYAYINYVKIEKEEQADVKTEEKAQ